MMKQYTFQIMIPYDEIMLYYQGQANAVYIQTEQGVSIEVDALHFREYVHANGIQGRFRLTTDDNNRFVSMERI